MRSVAWRILAVATISMVRVICFVEVTDLIRRSMSCRLGMVYLPYAAASKDCLKAAMASFRATLVSSLSFFSV